MKVASKILALLSIAALMLGTGAWTKGEVDHANAPLVTPAQHPSGCHAQGGNSLHGPSSSHSPLSYFPRQAPISYRCCLTGHVAALVQASDSSQPVAQYADVTLKIEPASTASFLNRIEGLTIIFVTPPGAAVLRV
jgi:hypothetical protein